ncbi:MAG TPA: hypothetical protein PLI09_26470 [Candidatus Hydrogenedentes bacterium]|nr:hypothetical protein [Candidatus Hydrogenedentota bacterium]
MSDEESFRRKNELSGRWHRRRRIHSKAHDILHEGEEESGEAITSRRRRIHRDPEWADTEKEDHPDDDYA